jgi:hypothetical protein
MRTDRRRARLLIFLAFAGLWFALPQRSHAQNSGATSMSAGATPDVRQLADSLRQLQEQVNTLSTEVSRLKQSNEEAHAETRQLRNELHRTAEQRVAVAAPSGSDPYAVTLPAPVPSASAVVSPSNTAAPQSSSLESRVTALEDNQELTDSRLQEQSQTKVESGSKYRVRLSGIILANAFTTVGSVNNIDFPQTAVPTEPGATSTSFAGSLRQSQIGVEVFGPEVAGARTSASINFDFSGGFPDQPNGTVMGLPRLRTGVFRMDWENTSIIAGQDTLFIAPLTPTSLSSLAIPALSYSGNLWLWTPQIRVEHRVELSENSKLLFQAGIMDSLTGNPPFNGVDREPSAGEASGQPAYAARVAWSHRAFGRDVIIGVGGYYGRQNWYYNRTVDGWAGTADVTIPLGRYFDFTGEFYRGRAVGGFGGGIGQSIVLDGAFTDPTTVIHGLDSMGGWAQMKYKPRANFELNFAFGQDNPFSSELREYPASSYYYGPLHPRNITAFANFIYHVRSNVMFSVEYRRIQTYNLDDGYDPANQIGVSVGYIF